ncbi:MAG: ATP-binding protein, partial [bacterium]
ITKVKNAEQALIQSEEQYRTLVNSLPDHVFRIDRDLNYIFTSPGLNTIAGVPDAEFVGKRVGGVLPDGHYTEQWRKTLQQVFETEIEQQVEVSLPEAMGGRSYHFRVLPELVEGKIKTVLAIGRDITDLKKAEEERLDLQLKLADARQQESMGLLAGGMAHDFNNLLAAIAGYTELALIELPEDSLARTYLEQNEIAIQKTADLTKRLLAYAGKSRLTKQSVNLYEAMKEALALQPKLPHDNLQIRGTINDGLPEIEADPTQVKQVIMNLVQNSFEALKYNEGAIFIDMDVVQADEAFLKDFIGAPDLAPGRYISIIVGDDGPGIAPEILPKIFEPFFTTKFAGHGLGLSTVLAIMQAHGGGIKVESNPGALTVFTLIFPLNEEAISAKIQPLSGDKKDRDADTILIIDDESSLRSLTSEMLKHIGLKSLEAENSVQGLDLFRLNANQIAVVLLDLTIEKNKAEIIVREVHKLMPEIPIVIMSGYDEQEAEKRFTSHEMAGFLHKPFSIRELKKMLFKSMGRPH